jgi:hypothetical protein
VRPTLYTVVLDGPGQLSTMAKPQGGGWLAEEMTGLREAGADMLVSALTASEMIEAELRDEPLEAAFAGLRFVSLPIVDMGLPDPAEVMPTLRELAGDLTTGLHIVTHCWAGIGRSSLLAHRHRPGRRLGTDIGRAWPYGPRNPGPTRVDLPRVLTRAWRVPGSLSGRLVRE